MKENSADRASEVLSKLLSVFESGKLVNIIAKQPLFINGDKTNKPSDLWSISNQILQIVNLTEDARGYKQWQKVGRQVKKGTNAFYISAPLVRKWKEINRLTGEEEERAFILGFKFIPVFRYEDTEGTPLSGTQEVIPKTLPPLFDVAEKLGVKVEYLPGRIGRQSSKAFGSFNPNNAKIKLYTADDKVFFHELAHAAHSTFRCLKTASPIEVEVVAETTAAVLAVMHGQEFVSGSIAESWEYVRTYSGEANKALQNINRFLNDVKKVLQIIFNEDKELCAA